ncbi:GNAT family N-acetyltransferase [Actinokineospora sp. NBRC 105648]|uniref:GNAT family N-acetyltransferase n=1 Tax=Actinokineospora sp. NBRC 105648 TaxID=3032206 RepID=UPI0024A2B984|nr:GNAT family N-acetyltransferase [Actinokineospora sp. NBRC 105648]GLZ42663.1 GNAT family acetyltransferase [Actinokineospora sp. NBRC 105648]
MSGIRTERLSLRPVTAADLAQVTEIQGDPAAARFRPGGANTPDESASQLVAWVEHWRAHGFGYWAVEVTATGALIGLGGLQHSEFDGERYLNLYYRFRPSSWGHGYAPEMARAAMDLAARQLPRLAVWIVTTVENTPARRVAEKLGFTEFREGMYAGALSRFYQWRGSGSSTSGATSSTNESNASSA